MGFFANFLGLGNLAREIGEATKNTAEIFHANETEAMQGEKERFLATLRAYEKEFSTRASWFSDVIDGINRIPRPALALGTIGLFVYAMVEPQGFAERMLGLALIPEPLWWLLGAIVGFYFGARELHYLRNVQTGGGLPRALWTLLRDSNTKDVSTPQEKEPQSTLDLENPAIKAWYESQQ